MATDEDSGYCLVVEEILHEGSTDFQSRSDKLRPHLRGIVVAVACVMGNLIVEGFVLDAPVMFPGLARKYDLSYFSVSLIGSILNGLWFCMSPIATILCRKFGQRMTVVVSGGIAALAVMISVYMPYYSLVVLLTGVIGGGCLGVAFLPCVTAASYHFTGAAQHVVIASGPVGGALGFFLFSVIANAVFEENPVDIYLAVSAGIIAHLVIIGVLVVSPKEKKSVKYDPSGSVQATVFTLSLNPESPVQNPTSEERAEAADSSKCDRERSAVLRQPWSSFVGYFQGFKKKFPGRLMVDLVAAVTCTVLWNIGSFGLLTALALSMEHDGVRDKDIAFVFVLQSILNVVGRISACILAVFRIRAWLYFIATVLSGAVILVLSFRRTYIMYSFVSAAYGLFFGYQCSLLPSVALHLFGVERMDDGVSAMLVSCGIGGVLGPLLIGALLDSGAGYAVTFGVLCAIIVAGGLAFIPALTRRNKTDQ